MLRRTILSNTVGFQAKRKFSAAAAATAAGGKKDKLVIFDTTLRDGEQAPGASLNTKDKLIIARQLSKLGVDVCEAGFPIASPGDFEAVKQIAIEIGPLKEGRLSGKPMTICGLSRSVEQDIQRAYDAIRYAPSHRIHTFLATSDIHLQYKLKISREKCIEQAVRAVKFAKERTPDVEFSAEDAGRSDPAFLAEIFSEVIKAGATTLNIPDTVGFVTPQEYGALIKYLMEHTKGVENVVLSTHCHNDLGLAVANTLSGIINGARQVEVTVNGIGERAGNSSLEEVVMALHTRPHLFPAACSIDTTQIMRSSKMVSQLTGIVVQPNKAIVGANAFAHESGIHQDGILKHQATYEIMRPETVGIVSTLVMGKHSGKHAFISRLKELGYGEVVEDKEKVAKMFAQFKRVADAKKTCTDADIEAIISDELSQPEELWKLNSVTVVAGISHPTATVSLTTPSGEVVQDAALGSGPIGAIYKAISRVIGVNIKLVDFHVEAVSEGQNSLGHVSVRIKNMDEEVATAEGGEDFDDVSYGGHSADIDTMVASARAFVGSINQMLSARKTPSRLRPPGRVTRHPSVQVPLP